AFVLETSHTKEAGIQRGRRIAALSEDADGLNCGLTVVDVQIEQKSGIQRIALVMQSVSCVFDEDDLIRIPESAVIKRGLWSIASIQQPQLSRVGANKFQPEDRSESTVVRACLSVNVRIAGCIENELGKARSRTELTVFRTLERCRICLLGQIVCIEGSRISRAVMNGDPVRLKHIAVGMEVLLILRQNCSVRICGSGR